MKYAIGSLLFSVSLLFSSASDDKNKGNQTRQEQLQRLRSMSGGNLGVMNPYKLSLGGSGGKKIRRNKSGQRPKSKSFVAHSTVSAVTLPDDRGAGELLRRSSDERIESPRIKSGNLKRMTSLKRMQELLLREKEKEVFEGSLIKEELILYRSLGYTDFTYVQKIDGLLDFLKDDYGRRKDAIRVAYIYTAYLRERMAWLKKPTQLIKVASSSIMQEGSPRGRTTTKSVLLNIQGVPTGVPFVARGDYSQKDQEQLYKILGSADFEFVKKTKGLLPVLLALVDAQTESSKIWTSYTGYLRLKIAKREKSRAVLSDDISPRDESPRTVASIISEASKEKTYSPRKQGAPAQLDNVTRNTRERLNAATQQLDGALTGMDSLERSAIAAKKD